MLAIVTDREAPEPSDTRRSGLLEAALRQFARSGYRRTRVEDIAAELGLTKGAVYFYYDSKESLYRGAIEWALSSWCIAVEGAVAQTANASAGFETLARRSLSYLAERPDVRAIIAADPSIYSLDPRQDRFASVNGRARGLLASTLRRGIDAGEFRPELDVERVAKFIYQVYIAFLIKAFAIGEGAEALELYEAGIDIALKGLEARSR